MINDNGQAIQGTGGANFPGVSGFSEQGDGVRATSTEGNGLFGKTTGGSGNTAIAGVYGTSSGSRTGVLGESIDAPGVNGVSVNASGMVGTSTNSDGVLGLGGGGGHGVTGWGGNGAGVAAFNFNHNQVSAYLATPWFFPGSALAGLFNGGVVVVGGFAVTGTKSAVVKHPDGSDRQLYCMESPESWFEDFGVGQLNEGQADVHLDRDFAALVRTDNYHVFLTPYGDSNGLYIAHIQPDGFVVREQHGGKHSLEFGYRVVAKRGDVDVVRLQPYQLPAQPVAPQPPHRQPRTA